MTSLEQLSLAEFSGKIARPKVYENMSSQNLNVKVLRFSLLIEGGYDIRKSVY